jgi:hypothetical protein
MHVTALAYLNGVELWDLFLVYVLLIHPDRQKTVRTNSPQLFLMASEGRSGDHLPSPRLDDSRNLVLWKFALQNLFDSVSKLYLCAQSQSPGMDPWCSRLQMASSRRRSQRQAIAHEWRGEHRIQFHHWRESPGGNHKCRKHCDHYRSGRGTRRHRFGSDPSPHTSVQTKDY